MISHIILLSPSATIGKDPMVHLTPHEQSCESSWELELNLPQENERSEQSLLNLETKVEFL